MLNNLCPKRQINSILDLKAEELLAAGMEAVVFDLDNTLVEWHQDRLKPEVINLVEVLKSNGLKVCILSNALEYRVRAIAAVLDVFYVAKAMKPRKGAFRKAVKLLGTTAEKTVMVGDQLFTDILGANKANLFTVWSAPMNNVEFIYTRMVRIFERMVIKSFKKKGILK